MDITTAQIQQLLARHTSWALHPDALQALVAAANGAGRPATISAELEHSAAAAPATSGGVAVLPLQGIITPRPSFLSMLFGGGGGLIGFRSQLREAVGAQDVSAIVIDIDSPGGSTDLVAETAAEIRAAREIKPVVAVANTWAASAAYWLAAQCTEIVVTPSGETGSIGVFTAHQDVSKMQDEIGIKTTLISAGKYKTEGNAYEPLSEEARLAILAKTEDYYASFVADVAKGRGVSAASVRGGYGEGRLLTAKHSLEAGLVDKIDTLEATVTRLVGKPGRAGRRRSLAEHPPSPDGTPEPNPPTGGEEAPVRPSQSYIDLMYGATR